MPQFQQASNESWCFLPHLGQVHIGMLRIIIQRLCVIHYGHARVPLAVPLPVLASGEIQRVTVNHPEKALAEAQPVAPTDSASRSQHSHNPLTRPAPAADR